MKITFFSACERSFELKNFQQGAYDMASEDGDGVMNLYLCKLCNAAMCLACGTVGVTQHHFYGQVQLNEIRTFMYSYVRDRDQKMPGLALRWGSVQGSGER